MFIRSRIIAMVGILSSAFISLGASSESRELKARASTPLPANVNIALTGPHNRVTTRYSASQTSTPTTPEGAFDGYESYRNTKLDENANTQVLNGAWISGRSTHDQWLKVDFDRQVKVGGFKIFVNPAYANFSGRGARDIVVQGSNDGVNFFNLERITLAKSAVNKVKLSKPTYLHSLRLWFFNNYGGRYLQVDELEVYERMTFAELEHDNVALVGSHGLNEFDHWSSTDSNSSYRAFDGYVHPNIQINEHAQPLNSPVTYWAPGSREGSLQVDLHQSRKVTAIRFLVEQMAAALGRGPRDVTIEISNDGEDFFEHTSFRLDPVADQTVPLERTLKARFVRIVMHATGRTEVLRVDDIELLQRNTNTTMATSSSSLGGH